MPITSVELGLVSGNVAFSQRMFALTVTQAQSDAGEALPDSVFAWPVSEGLGGSFAYLGGSDAPGEIAWAVRRLQMSQPVQSLTVKVHPWDARRDRIVSTCRWQELVHRSLPIGPQSAALFGMHPLKGARA